MKNVNTIIFDLGEVIIDLDAPRVIEAFEQRSGNRSSNIKEMLVTSSLLHKFETGKMEEIDFADEVMKLLEMNLTFQEFELIWNYMLKGIPKARLELLDNLRQNHQILILSNTNSIHQRKFDQMIDDLTGKGSMSALVDKAHYSHDLGYRKPEKKIYELLIDEHHLTPQKTMFLDDRADNIEAAGSLGIQAIQIKNPDQLFDVFPI
jgi:putative hydrolase of the HAD superfamily